MTTPFAITLNGERHEFAESTTVLDLVSTLTDKQLSPDGTTTDGTRLGIAVAIDGDVLRRGLWSTVDVAEGASIDIVTAVQGG